VNPTHMQTIKEIIKETRLWLSISFDKTAAWVTKLSWWKFFLFAIITLSAGAMLQDMLFTSEESIIVTKNKHDQKQKHNPQTLDGDTSIEIDDTGIHIRKNNGDGKIKQIEIDGNGAKVHMDPATTLTPATPPESAPDHRLP